MQDKRRPPRTLPLLLCALPLCAALAACAPQEEEEGEVDPRAEVFDESGAPPRDGKADGTAATWVQDPLPVGADLSRPLEVLFGPDEPLVTLELRMIDRVVQARKADGGAYPEGSNPYRIRYATYNMRNKVLYTALADAADAGVDVQILIESQQLNPDNTFNVGDEYLAGRGFEVVTDHKTLTDTTRKTADLIGIRKSGLMHLKARLFETKTERALLTGSFNPGDESIYSEENYHLIRDARIIDRYIAAYDAVIRGQQIPNVWTEGAALNVLFNPEASGPRAATQLFAWLDAEREQILLSVFALRNIQAPGDSRKLVDLLAAKVKAGVPVWAIVDKKQSDGIEANGFRSQPDDKTEDLLRAAGVHVYEVMNNATEYAAMHHKVAILGRTNLRVITDSTNWTQSALGSATAKATNYESMLFIDSAKLDGNRTGRRYLAQWLRVLERWAAQAQSVEPSYAAALAALTALPSWPAQGLIFAVQGATPVSGDQVRVIGDRPELGAWEAGGLGVVMPKSGTEWRSPAVRVPVGVGLSYKFAIGRSGLKATRIEGMGRTGRAGPPLLLAQDPPVLGGPWQP